MYKGHTPFRPTPQLMVQYCTFHLGVVRDVKDPEGRGRVCVEVPGLYSTGKKNWTDWIDVAGTPLGSNNDKGDEGIWWPMQVGQSVLVGFVSGDPFAMWCIPGPPCQDGKGENKQLTPLEPKIVGKKDRRGATRIRTIKGEAGHTLLMDDRGGKEKLALMDWTGSGLFTVAPGKKEDQKEKTGDGSKPRKGERRGTKMVVTGTSEKPKELLAAGAHFVRLCDLNGQGTVSVASDKAGRLALFVAGENGSIGPSILMDVNDKSGAASIIISAGAAQIALDAKQGVISFTPVMMAQHKRVKVEKVIAKMCEAISKAYEEFNET
ncbi:MAG: phage baseplate assembly protein V [Thermodesulfobacteriota bacterium]